jgi:hypothetical protein
MIPTPMLGLRRALELLHKPECRLVQVNGKTKLEYYVMPGGRVPDAIASAILARPDMMPCDPGLLPDCPQSWQRQVVLTKSN